MKNQVKIFVLLALCLPLWSAAQQAPPKDWFLLSPSSDAYPGVGIEKTYDELLKGRSSQTVIVAVLDSGIETDHDDLRDIMWVNEDEIPGNGIDDDNNGYIDDIHGWNFLGNAKGENIHHDALEITRLAAMYKKKFDGKSVTSLSKKEKKEYAYYQTLLKEIEEKRQEASEKGGTFIMLANAIKSLEEAAGGELNSKTFGDVKPGSPEGEQAKAMLENIMTANNLDFETLREEIKGAAEYFESQLEYYYNIEYDPRSMVGDDYNNLKEKGYGNNDYEGPDANHGTHVAGIIGGDRNNDVGMKGISNNVRIMTVRCVPDGDERDKDVANAIRYAVDNGASIINMSFGKSYAWDKDVVDEAVKYAKKKDVLLVHAAGNDGKNIDENANFPNDKYRKRGWFRPKRAKNWIEVGALNYQNDENLAASFSNYGEDDVDIFAPGVKIYSSVTDNTYDSYPGTSMASPVVAGVAAVLRSYFPGLTAEQVKEIIMESSSKVDREVVVPGSEDKMPFSKLSKTGGMLDAYKAVQQAMKTKGKKKVKKAKKETVKVIRP